MARKYKKNRERGTRARQYKLKKYLGYILPRASEYNTLGEYVDRFIEINRDELENAYNRDLRRISKSKNVANPAQAVSNFQRVNPDLRTYVLNQFQEGVGKDVSQKKTIKVRDVKMRISAKFAKQTERQIQHTVDLITKDESFMEDFFYALEEVAADEEFNPNALSYTGNDTFSYIAKNGAIIRFRYKTKKSPISFELIE